MQCPIARSLERVGEWWSILILRDALMVDKISGRELSERDYYLVSGPAAGESMKRRLSVAEEK